MVFSPSHECVCYCSSIPSSPTPAAASVSHGDAHIGVQTNDSRLNSHNDGMHGYSPSSVCSPNGGLRATVSGNIGSSSPSSPSSPTSRAYSAPPAPSFGSKYQEKVVLAPIYPRNDRDENFKTFKSQYDARKSKLRSNINQYSKQDLPAKESTSNSQSVYKMDPLQGMDLTLSEELLYSQVTNPNNCEYSNQSSLYGDMQNLLGSDGLMDQRATKRSRADFGGNFDSFSPIAQVMTTDANNVPMPAVNPFQDPDLGALFGMISPDSQNNFPMDISNSMRIPQEHSQPVQHIDPTEREWSEKLDLATRKLQDIEQFLHHCRTVTEELKAAQSKLTLPVSAQIYQQLSSQETALLSKLDLAAKELQRLVETNVLSPNLLTITLNLQLEVRVCTLQLKLFLAELEDMMKTNKVVATCFAALIIVKQPFPKTLKQNTKSSTPDEDPTLVKLLRGANSKVQVTSPVKAVMWHEEFQTRRASFDIQNDLQELGEDDIANFSEMRFSQGTRVKMVRVQFGCDVQFRGADGTVATTVIESDTSNPFVVTTNENQWDSSAGILLKKDAFENNTEIAWPKFANTLQFHFLRSIRQNIAEPDRPLSRHDLEYIHRYKFNSATMINHKDFDQFWQWFGRVLHRIRHQKLFRGMWNVGAIYGFVSKEVAVKLLKNETNGTFIIRFSERCPGQVAVAYVKQDPVSFQNEIRHYLVETFTKEQNIADLFREHRQWMFVMQLKTDFAPTGGNIKCKVRKDLILDEFYTKKKPQNIDGYEKEVY